MSATPYLLLLLLCLSLHICNGRRLIVDTNQKNEKDLLISDQSTDPKEISATTMLETVGEYNAIPTNSSSRKGEPLQQDHAKTDHHRLVDAAKQVMKDSKLPRQKGATGSRSKRSGSAKKSVTWRVPQNKQREEHPDLNLDYSPPKTHPPSHN